MLIDSLSSLFRAVLVSAGITFSSQTDLPQPVAGICPDLTITTDTCLLDHIVQTQYELQQTQIETIPVHIRSACFLLTDFSLNGYNQNPTFTNLLSLARTYNQCLQRLDY